MNKYATVFFGFIAIIIVAYFVTRHGINSGAKELDTASGAKQEVVVKKYTEADKAKVLKDTSSDFYMGKDMAPVLMIEYASLSCPHCKDFHEKVVDPLIPTYIESGKVKYVFRDYPLNAPALEAAKIAHCSGKDRFFSFVKVLFQSQPNWVISDKDDELKKIAALGGIDEAAFNTCINDKALENQILKTQKDAADILGVSSTPTIFINGHKYDGKHSFEDVAAFIDQQLKGGQDTK